MDRSWGRLRALPCGDWTSTEAEEGGIIQDAKTGGTDSFTKAHKGQKSPKATDLWAKVFQPFAVKGRV